jgi:MGT family glycosyltransferase
MAKIWCISAPLFSHTDWGGFLKTAQTLHRMGHEVTWLSGMGLTAPIQRAMLPFRALEQTGWLWPPPQLPHDAHTLPPQEAIMLRYRRALDTWLTEDLVAQGTQAILDTAAEGGPPDLIITDPFLSASALAAEKLGVPLVVCGWPAQRELEEDHLFPVQRSLGHESRQRLDNLKARFGLEGVNFSEGPTPSVLSPLLHICYFSESWYQSEVAFMLDQTLFVGGQPAPPANTPPGWLTDIPTDQPLALITLGTVFTGDTGFFAWAAQAATAAGYLPLVVIGWNPIAPDEKSKLIAALPRRSRLLNFVPFDHVLPRVGLMFHHGGMGTTHAAVIHAVPQIVVPHAADQRGQARRAAQAKVGLNLTAHDVRNGKLLEGALALRQDEQVKQYARDLAAEMASLGGVEAAADAIVKLL